MRWLQMALEVRDAAGAYRRRSVVCECDEAADSSVAALAYRAALYRLLVALEEELACLPEVQVQVQERTVGFAGDFRDGHPPPADDEAQERKAGSGGVT